MRVKNGTQLRLTNISAETGRQAHVVDVDALTLMNHGTVDGNAAVTSGLSDSDTAVQGRSSEQLVRLAPHGHDLDDAPYKMHELALYRMLAHQHRLP